jgi:small-conductance mechanosensitive channel
MKPEYIYMTVIAPLFILLPLITAFFKYQTLPIESRILFWYLLTDAVVNIISSVLVSFHFSNTPLYHIATIIETEIILYFFFVVFQQTTTRKFIKLSMLFFPVLGIFNTFLLQHIFEFNSYTLSLQSLIIIALCFLYWWNTEDDNSKSWSAMPLNWILSGLLIYFSSAFILFTFSNAAIAYLSVKNFIIVWNIHATLSILMYMLITIGFTKYKK